MHTWDFGRQRLGNQRELNPNCRVWCTALSTSKSSPQKPPCCTHTFSELLSSKLITSHRHFQVHFSTPEVTLAVILTSQTQGNCNYSSTKLFPLLVTRTANRILLGCCFPHDWCHGDHSQDAYTTPQQHLGVEQQLRQASTTPKMTGTPNNALGRRKVTTTLNTGYKTRPRKT